MRFLEFSKTAEIITDFALGIKPGENVLIVRDTRSSEFAGVDGLFAAIVSSVHRKTAEPQVLTYVTRPLAGMEPPRVVAAAMRSSDVVIIMTTLSIFQTVATTEALRAGARVLLLPPARYIQNSPDLLFRLMPTDSREEQERMRLAASIAEMMRKGRQIRVTSPKGTEITMGIGQLDVLYNPTTAREPGQTTIIPGGQITAGVTLGEAEGRFVVDASASPMYRPLKNPIEMVVKGGRVVEISGQEDANEYRTLLQNFGDPQVYQIAEVGIGINPDARLSGTPLEDERILGAVWIAVGTNVHIGGTVKAAIHSDCVMLPPLKVEVDEKLVMNDRHFYV